MSDNNKDDKHDKDDKDNKIDNFYLKRIDEINNFVINFIVLYHYREILDIGAGKTPFIFATKLIDYNTKYDINNNNDKIKVYNNLDIDTNKLPFENKSLDFVYSRHTLQEIQNPDFVMNEIIRITNAGYIETPSPLIEITKGIDRISNINNYAGYIHHRYIIWSDNEKCEIYFLPKYSSILDNIMILNVDKNLYSYKYYWNNYFLWKDKTPKIIIYKNEINFGLDNNFIKDYLELVYTAVNKSIENTDKFLLNHKATKYIY